MTPVAIANRCEHCGTAFGEICRSELVDAWVCKSCFLRAANAEGDPTEETPRPIEPVTPLEPVKGPSSLYCENGSKNSSVGPRDGSMGVDETAARVKALGIAAPLGEQFGCILPGHVDSARVHSTTRKHWHYRCESEQRGLGLAEVRATIGYEAVRRITAVEAARWKERLDYEAGLREPRAVEFTVMGSESTRRVANGLRLFLGLRDERWDGQPFTWARPFVMAYCQVTDQQARDAVYELREKQKIIVPTGKRVGWAILWQLAGESGGTP
jgi:hypothetical protein